MKNSFGNNLPVVNLYKNTSLKSKISTQLLYGDNFKVLKKFGIWKKIKIKKDGYTGYIKNSKFSKPIKANFKVCVLKARLFSHPTSQKKMNKFLVVILAWNFSKDIISKLKEYDKEIIVLIPLPKFIVTKI